MSIGNQIKKYRKKAHLSQKELGNMLNLSQQMIAQYENGKRIPKLESLEKIANALNVPIFYLKKDIITEFHTNDEKEQILILLKMLYKDLEIQKNQSSYTDINGNTETENTYIISYENRQLFLDEDEFNELINSFKKNFKKFLP